MIGGTRQFPTNAVYTGYNQHATAGSRTAQDEDIAKGSIVQIDLKNHGSTSDGFECAVPTAGFRGPLAVVDENISAADLSANAGGVNYEAGVTANLRAGGRIPLVCVGKCRARVKANCVAGVTPLGPVTGQMYLSEILPNGVLHAITTPETSDGSGTSEVFFTSSQYSIPANTLRAGDTIKIRAALTVANSNSTDTVTPKIYFGGTSLLVTGTAPDAVNADVIVADIEVTIRTIGASGTAYASVVAALDTDAEGDPAVVRTVAEFSIDTTAAIVLRASSTWTGGHANDDLRLDQFTITKSASPSAAIGPTNQPFAIAATTVDNSAATTAGGQLTDVFIVQGPPF